MTVCKAFGKKHHRRCHQSTPDDPKMERGDVSAITGPLHTLLHALPQLADRSSSIKQVSSQKGSMVRNFPLIPVIEDEVEGLPPRPAVVPSLKLKPRSRSHGMGKNSKFNTKSSVSRVTKNTVANSRSIAVTPPFLSRDALSPLRERHETKLNTLIIGESLLGKNRASIDRSGTIPKNIETKRVPHFEMSTVPPPTLILKPRSRGSSPKSSTNKENLKNCELPLLLTPWDHNA